MTIQAVNFKGYNNILKTAWKAHKLPTVTKGIYGKTLTIDNISLEHIIPRSLGGKTSIENLFLADKFENSKRGIKPIEDVITQKQLISYLRQFLGVHTQGFDGNDYILKIMKTIAKIGGLKKWTYLKKYHSQINF